MLDVYTSLSQVKMSDLNFPLSFLTNVIRVQAPKIKRGILCRIGVYKTQFLVDCVSKLTENEISLKDWVLGWY